MTRASTQRSTPPGAQVFVRDSPLELHLGAKLPSLQIAYETWGTLSGKKDNAVLLCTGLSASSHARSHEQNPAPGWWEGMIGPGAAIDTNRWFVVCCNILGGCFGSTGPASIDARTQRPYAMKFPVVTVWDFALTQSLVLDALGIEKLGAVVGSSLGGMQALAFAARFPARVKRVIAISAPGRSYPLSIALRHVQREAVMRDPAWNGGEYYGGPGPREGLHLARQIGTITYRSGREWDDRFARERTRPHPSDLGIDFQIESYLSYQGDKFADSYDPNSYLYISKAMDLFDLGDGAESYEAGVARIEADTLIIGVTTDMLFPLHQQEELARLLFDAHGRCRFFRIDSSFGHDAFLIEIEPFAEMIRPFLNG